ncbi:MAG: triosephosphate isomerase [Sphingobacteriales bacterium BACL12 MAG-120813-bin55]|nr:MAG: triosephosphate isomerase [Sphingobacteriales bacterium BACL12 MAG-120802-bin5]KRP13061.1 MAG: triosephosphate isomerase [Sphingobacteriales bacterium BACL12 MAG-120813-bin55]
MRQTIVAGNWKMHKTLQEASSTIDVITSGLTGKAVKAAVWIAPPALYIPTLREKSAAAIQYGAQDVSQHDQGAYTGEIAAPMLHSAGATFAIVGHSERRQYHGEDDTQIHQKILACLRHQLTAVYCCGERLEQREAGEHKQVVSTQVRAALLALSKEAMQHVVIAYEPVWAIGTGVTASTEQAGEMHRHIRAELAAIFDEATAEKVQILYGGSVKPGNAAELFSDPDIDGGLIGGASLNAADFLSIIEAAG